jgi:hypothetical protein
MISSPKGLDTPASVALLFIAIWLFHWASPGLSSVDIPHFWNLQHPTTEALASLSKLYPFPS